jgi:hypothetical protein
MAQLAAMAATILNGLIVATPDKRYYRASMEVARQGPFRREMALPCLKEECRIRQNPTLL